MAGLDLSSLDEIRLAEELRIYFSRVEKQGLDFEEARGEVLLVVGRFLENGGDHASLVQIRDLIAATVEMRIQYYVKRHLLRFQGAYESHARKTN